MPQDKEVFTPAEAFERSSALFLNLTGKTSPDIVLFASCLWYVILALPLSIVPGPRTHLPAQPCANLALTLTLTLGSAAVDGPVRDGSDPTQ